MITALAPSPVSTQCRYCGRDNPDAATQCAECGIDLRPEPDAWQPLVDSKAANWILQTWRWALNQFGAEYFYQDTILVTPTREHFPENSGDPEEMARLVFRRVQEYAGLQDWPCKLVPQQPDVEPRLDQLTVLENPPGGPGGTFRVTGAAEPKIEITYNPDAVARPQELVAIFAHELAHYLGQTAQCRPPGVDNRWEDATDLLAVHMGFGIFLANAAVSFAQFSEGLTLGWTSRTSGYLSEFEVVYCLALFCVLKEIRSDHVKPHLKPSLAAVYDDALRDLQRKAETLADLRSVNPARSDDKA